MNALTMHRLIVAHESRILLRTPAFGLMLAALAIAIIFAAWSGARAVERQQRGLTAATAHADQVAVKLRQGRALMVGVGPISNRNPGIVGHTLNTYAALPPTGLSALSIGQTDLKLRYLPVSMMDDLNNTNNSFSILRDGEIENPVNLKKGSFDVAFVIVFLLPILIITMSYDLLSSEKERGTLSMVLSHPVSLRKLIASKLLCRFGMLLAVVLLVNGVALLAVGAQLDQPETWVRFAVWLSATILYALFWFAMATLVNARGGSSSTNGIALAATWLAVVVVIPTLVSLVATTLYPAPSRMDFITAQRDAQTTAEETYMNTLNRYAYDHPGLVADGVKLMDDFVMVREAKNDAVVAAVRPLHEEFQRQLQRQEAVVTRCQFLSPAIMMQRILNEAAGSSTERYGEFTRKVAAFQRQFKDFFMQRLLTSKAVSDADYDMIPAFKYDREPIGAVLGRVASSLLGMMLVISGFAAIALKALRRYPVTG